MSEPFVLMHVSDLHFHRLPCNPLRYASKRALGGLNLLLRRRRDFPPERARRLVATLDAASWQHLLVTGDLTQLGLPEEFARAREALAPLLARGPEAVTVVPGNHDRYVPEPPGNGAYEASFGDFAGGSVDGVATRRLTDRWWLVAWDSAAPAPWYAAEGTVRPETLAATDAFLAGLPAGAQVILANHYPLFFPPPHRVRRHHELTNLGAVRDWVLARPFRLYLHGHVHHNWVLTVPGAHGLLTVVNSASSTQRPRPGDPSAYHRIVLRGAEFAVEPQRYG